jgi:ABC-2 type transport system ATP-binding protein
MHTPTAPQPEQGTLPRQLPGLAPVLSVHGLTKSYGPHTAVGDVSFDISKGQVVGLIGPNGAGKTTLMKALLGLVKPSSGTIDLLGHRVGSSGWGTALHRVGSMIEAPALYGWMSARDNLTLQAMSVGVANSDRRVEEVLELIGLDHRADDDARTFSLGMKQRLGIGVSVIGEPEFVILDEPANGLDPAGIIEIRNLLRRLPEFGTTVLVSSHQLAEVQQACDDLVIMSAGRIVTTGSTAGVLAHHAERTFEIDVLTSEAGAALAALTTAGHVVELDGDRLILRDAAEIDGRELNRTLLDAGVIASQLAERSTSLEEVFLSITTPGRES